MSRWDHVSRYGKQIINDLELERDTLKKEMREIINVLGPTAPKCGGCSSEIDEALSIAKKAAARKWGARGTQA